MTFTPKDRNTLEQLAREAMQASQRLENALDTISRIETRIEVLEHDIEAYRELPLRARLYKVTDNKLEWEA